MRFEVGSEENPIDTIKEEMEKINVVELGAHGRFESGYVGYFSYETIRHIENVPIPTEKSASGISESIFFLPRVTVVFDHFKHVIYLHYLMSLSGDIGKNFNEAEKAVFDILDDMKKNVSVPVPCKHSPLVNYSLEPSRDEFIEIAKKAKSLIEEGEIFQVVLSHSFQAKTKKTHFEIYRDLRRKNPSPYMYFLRYEDFSIVGASPETLVRVSDGEVLLRPIAGTRPRGKTPKEDFDLENDLKKDPKECAEHMMLVDLGRNDVGRIADLVNVTKMMYVQRFSTVMHMVSDVVGRLRRGKNMFDVFKASFPAGTLSGAPKIRAEEIISTLEKRQRGIYGGAIGYFDFSGDMDFAIAIRTMVCRGEDVFLQAGAGLVYDSVPEKEHEECLHKAKSCLFSI